MSQGRDGIGFWTGGISRFFKALARDEAEELARLEKEMIDADDERRAELEHEILEARAKFESERQGGGQSLFLAKGPKDGGET